MPDPSQPYRAHLLYATDLAQYMFGTVDQLGVDGIHETVKHVASGASQHDEDGGRDHQSDDRIGSLESGRDAGGTEDHSQRGEAIGAGVKPVGHPPLMLRTPGGDRRPPPPDLEIVEVSDAETLRTFEQTAIHAYPMPELEAAGAGGFMPASLLDDNAFRFYLGFVDGQPVATSMAHLSASMSHVEYVTTIPAVRGRGYGEAMTWPATLVDPDAPSMLIASDLGRPIYERMGYLTVARFTLGAGARAKGEG